MDCNIYIYIRKTYSELWSCGSLLRVTLQLSVVTEMMIYELEKSNHGLIEVISQRLPGGTVENHWNPVRIGGVRAII
jgi:hypothetical protein